MLGKTTFLDPSVPGAWEFLLRVFDTLFVTWGFKGVNLDFMTHWFTREQARYRNGGSGPQVLLPGRKTFLLNMDSAGFGDVIVRRGN